MMGRFRAVAVLAAALAASPVLAQPTQPPTEQQKIAAGSLVKQAIAKSQAGDHEAAIKLYLDAYVIVPNPILLSNVGSEYKQAKKLVDALKYFCMYLEKDPTGANASYALSEATIIHMELEVRGEVCKPEPVEKPAPPDPDPAGEPLPEPPKPSGDPGRGLRIAGLGVAGAGVISLGAGVFFGLKAKENSDLISNHNMADEWPANIKQIEADGQTYENRQVIFTIAGGALITTGVVVYFIGRSKKSETSVSVTPTVTSETAGVSLSGSF